MGPNQEDTIFAVASGVGRAAIVVVRLSGPRCKDVLIATTGKLPEARRATLAEIRSPKERALIDEGLVFWFPGPSSFTGEDLAELHIHGGRAVVSAVIRLLTEFVGIRPALPGEFTRRAFLNGKMDLTQVEGLADLIDSETEHQRKQAVRQLKGNFGKMSAAWRLGILRSLAMVEALIDFPEENDVLFLQLGSSLKVASEIAEEIGYLLEKSVKGERLRDGILVVIAGPPNVGKSTLLNHLAGGEVAIVSAQAGTTRDVVRIDIEIAGYPVRFLDTAGLRLPRSRAEQAGISRAVDAGRQADLVLWLHTNQKSVLGHMGKFDSVPVWTVRSKSDLAGVGFKADWVVSVFSGMGISPLLDEISKFAGAILGSGGANEITQARHRRELETCLQALLRASSKDGNLAPELVAEDLRTALRCLARITGHADVEEILGEIFSRFCIGK